MKTIELFSGTQSFSKVAKEFGYNTFTVELDEYFEADLHKNILDVTVKDLPNDVNILWASPPCTSFSVASLRILFMHSAIVAISISSKSDIELTEAIRDMFFEIQNSHD